MRLLQRKLAFLGYKRLCESDWSLDSDLSLCSHNLVRHARFTNLTCDLKNCGSGPGDQAFLVQPHHKQWDISRLSCDGSVQ